MPLARAEPLVGAGAAPPGEPGWNAVRPPAKISDSGPDEAPGRLTVAMRCKPSLHLPTGHHRGLRVIMKRALLVIDVQNEYFAGRPAADHPPARPPRQHPARDGLRDRRRPAGRGRPAHLHAAGDALLQAGDPRLGAAPGGGLASARPLDREEPPRQLHRHGPGRVAARAGARYRDGRRVHDPHVLRHHRAPGGAPGPEGRVPLRRDGDPRR